MNNSKVLTWLIPVAALLVPGFLFYNWWTKLNAQSRSDLEKKVRSNPGLAVFMGGAGKDKLKNPLETQNAAVAPSTSTAAAVAPAASSGTLAAVPVSVSTGANLGAATPANTTAPVGAAPAVDTGTAVAPALPAVQITRDPTLSPYDVVKLQENDLEAKRRAGEIVEAAKPRVTKRREPPIEDSIDLQGIVEIAAGNKAIINGEMVGEGDMVLNKAKVLRITNSSVFFVYRGRKFSLSINK